MTPREIKRLLASVESKVRLETVEFDLSEILFPKQLPFGTEERRWQTAVCTRRAGKTYGCAAKLLSVARQKPGCVALYITKSRINAKRLLWDTLKAINDKYGLGGIALEGELCLAMPNASKIYLSGADHEAEIEKFRGLPIGIVLIDEAQLLPAYLEKLVDEVLAPALMDFNGLLVLVGTPGPVPIGYFYECSRKEKWAHHAWTVFDNPHIQRKSGRTPQDLLAEELERRGVAIDDPVIQREWFGKWVTDSNSLVFRFDPSKNAREAVVSPTETYHYVIGVDLGYEDSDAIAVLRWSDRSPELDIVYESVVAKQFITPLMNHLTELEAKYNPMAIVCDMGALGKKIAGEMQARSGVTIEAADKARKLEHIELLNDAMRTGKFFAPARSRFAADALLVEWDRSNPEKPVISDRFHSDICDAVLYAYRKCLQWLYVDPKAEGPKTGSVEWAKAQEELQRAELQVMIERQLQANREEEAEQRDFDRWLP